MSKYKIFDIRKSKPGNRLYFFDANVWLLILDPPLPLNHLQQAYIDFWGQLVNTYDGSRKLVAVNTVLISEVLNTYLRIRFSSYKDELVALGKETRKEVSKFDFKRDYRTSKSYEGSLISFQDDMSSYNSYIEAFDDKAQEIGLLNLLSTMPTGADFNDLYYYEFCKRYQFPIVTHDGDFNYTDHQILTCNPKLLGLSSLNF